MDEPLDTTLSIEAPEHIVFRHLLAGPARRAIAHTLDLFICYLAVFFAAILVILAMSGFAGFRTAFHWVEGASIGIILVLLFAAQWLYSFLWEGLTGRSPGKAAMGLRVVRVSGRPMGLGPAALRNVLRAADVLPGAYLVGVGSMALSSRFQRLGDLVAGTMVVITPSRRAVQPVVLFPPATAEELGQLPLVVPLDKDERVAIEMFLRRRDMLGPARADELARILTPDLAPRFGAPNIDSARWLALLYDRAVNAGRTEGPPSSRGSVAGWPPRLGAGPLR
jgi:uncharacterized RDD family membrane protein YckC